MSVTLITRADDIGSCHAANAAAVECAIRGGFIRNISCLAVGPAIEEAAYLMKDRKELCFGLHACITAEWDYIRFIPLMIKDRIPSLIENSISFPQTTQWYEQNPPHIEEIIVEYDAQLDFLTRLGFDIRYVDSHMLPECVIPELPDAFAQWARKKGLLFHMYYYRSPERLWPGMQQGLLDACLEWEYWLDSLVQGQYFAVLHPAKAGRETQYLANRWLAPGVVAKGRNAEYLLLARGILKHMCDHRNISCIRYDQAKPLTVLDPLLFGKGIEMP